MGKRKVGDGKGKGGREGVGRLASHTFLGPAPSAPGPRWGLRPPSPHHSEEIAATAIVKTSLLKIEELNVYKPGLPALRCI